MHQRSLLATGTWVAIGLTTWTIAWVIAESIPVFNDLLSLIVRCIPMIPIIGTFANLSLQSALFGSWFSCKFSQALRSSSPISILIVSRRSTLHLLDGHEQGTMVLVPEEDLGVHCQPDHPGNCMYHCKFRSPLPPQSRLQGTY